MLVEKNGSRWESCNEGKSLLLYSQRFLFQLMKKRMMFSALSQYALDAMKKKGKGVQACMRFANLATLTMEPDNKHTARLWHWMVA